MFGSQFGSHSPVFGSFNFLESQLFFIVINHSSTSKTVSSGAE